MSDLFKRVLADLTSSAETLDMLPDDRSAALASELRALIVRFSDATAPGAPATDLPAAPTVISLVDDPLEGADDEDDEDWPGAPDDLDDDELSDDVDGCWDDAEVEPFALDVTVTLSDGGDVSHDVMCDVLAGAQATLRLIGDYEIGTLGVPGATRVAQVTVTEPAGLPLVNGMCSTGVVPLADGRVAHLTLSRAGAGPETLADVAQHLTELAEGELPDVSALAVVLRREDGAAFDTANVQRPMSAALESLSHALGPVTMVHMALTDDIARLSIALAGGGPLPAGVFAAGLAAWRGSLTFPDVGLVHAHAELL